MAGLKNAARGCLSSAGYCAAFLFAWRYSVDQWYLPAGLRFACLLFLPARRWPWLFIGEAAALLAIRVPMAAAWGASPTWAYLSPFLLMPAVSLLLVTARHRIPDLAARDHMLLLLALVTALWGTLCNLALNAALGGPVGPAPLDALLRFWLGDYLGILMFMLPVLLWLRRAEPARLPSHLLREGIASVVIVAVLFGVLAFVRDGVLRQLLMVLLVVPSIALTLRHGWRGAALGVVLANVAVALSLPKTLEIGAHNAQVFSVQVLLAAAATGLFAFGSRLSASYAQARRLGRVREQALEFAQAGYLSAERTLRRRVVEYTDVHVHINKLRKDVVEYLRSRGHHAAAMHMTRTGVIQAQLLDEYVTALYPLGIETHGLYYILRTVTFANLCSTEFRLRFRGDARQLSLGLQLVAYRCVLNTLETLPLARTHLIQARVWKAKGVQGIAVRVTADASVLDSVRREHPDSDFELLARLQAHGGTCRRRHAFCMSFLVSERIGVGLNFSK